MSAVITRRGLILGAISVAARAQKTTSGDPDFSEWQSFGSGTWTAEGAELVGRFAKNKPGPGYLFTRQSFTDFRLVVLFRISKGGNCKIYVREPRRKWSIDGDNRPGFGPDGGYKVLIDYQNRDNPTGTIDNIQKSRKLVGSEDRWTQMEIICRGAEIRISLEGQNVNRFNQLRIQPGVIGFEVPGAASQDFIVRFRDIVISSIT